MIPCVLVFLLKVIVSFVGFYHYVFSFCAIKVTNISNINECTECGYSYSCECKFNYHLLKHHGEWPFSCPVCDCVCIETQVIYMNMLNHSHETLCIPYQCYICNLMHPYSLINIHTSEKPLL